MREIDVRDLKRSLSETLRAVERGEQVRSRYVDARSPTSSPPAQPLAMTAFERSWPKVG
jgi:hypothetical protein